MLFKKYVLGVISFVVVFLGIVLATQAATCTGVFFGGTGLCYSTGSTGGVQTNTILTGNGVSPLSTTTIGAGLTLSGGSLSLSSPVSVSNGGTGVSTLGQGWLSTPGGTTAFTASTSPTVNYITATSTTASSTFAYSANLTSGGVATNNVYLARPAAVYATSTPGTNVKIVFTGARDSAPSFAVGAPGTLTLASNTASILVALWAGGAGGGGGAQSASGGNGGSGGLEITAYTY